MTARPPMPNAERAARNIANRHVREGLITRGTANTVLKVAVPIATQGMAQARLAGRSPEWITAWYQRKLAAATTPVSRVTAEISLAIWAGMQVDAAEFANSRHAVDSATTPQIGS